MKMTNTKDPLSHPRGFLHLLRTGYANQGFTLVELMVILGVIGILLFFFSSSLDRRSTTRDILAQTAHSLQASLNFAREKSITRGVDVSVSSLAGGWESGWLIDVDLPAPDQDTEDKAVNTKFGKIEGNTITKTGNASITFRNGSAINPASFILCNFERTEDNRLTRYQRVIAVNFVGRVRMIKGDEAELYDTEEKRTKHVCP